MFFPVLCKKTERTGQEKAEKYGTGAMQEEEPHRRSQKHDIPARRNTGKERPAHAQKFFPGRRKATFSTFPISKISHIHGTPLLQARPMSFVRRGLDIGVNQPGSIIPQFFRAMKHRLRVLRHKKVEGESQNKWQELGLNLSRPPPQLILLASTELPLVLFKCSGNSIITTKFTGANVA